MSLKTMLDIARPELVATEARPVNTELLMQQLALEADYVANVVQVFKELIPGLVAKIRDIGHSFTAYHADDLVITRLEEHARALADKLPLVNFADYERLLISVPEGFRGNLLAYLTLLNELCPVIYCEINRLLGEYKLILAAFITNKDAKIALKDYTKLYKEVDQHREKFAQQIKAYFPDGVGDSGKAPLGKSIERFADIRQLTVIAKDLTRNKGKQNLNEIASGVDQIVKYLDIVLEEVNQGNITNISGAAAKNIAEGATALARFVEFVSIFNYRIEQATASVSKLVEQLDTQVLK